MTINMLYQLHNINLFFAKSNCVIRLTKNKRHNVQNNSDLEDYEDIVI